MFSTYLAAIEGWIALALGSPFAVCRRDAHRYVSLARQADGGIALAILPSLQLSEALGRLPVQDSLVRVVRFDVNCTAEQLLRPGTMPAAVEVQQSPD